LPSTERREVSLLKRAWREDKERGVRVRIGGGWEEV
jgi:hypothetical protein